MSCVYSDRFIPLLFLFIKYSSKSFKNSENKIGDRFSPFLQSSCMLHTHARTHTRARAHTHTHALTHARTRAGTHAHTHAGTHALTRISAFSWRWFDPEGLHYQNMYPPGLTMILKQDHWPNTLLRYAHMICVLKST